MRRPLASLCATALLLASSSTAASAQRVLGVGDDALVLPRGVFRVRVLSQWTRFDQRYGEGTPGRMKGALEPLAVDFNLDTIGLAQFPALAAAQAGFRAVSGINDFDVSLGRTLVTSNARVIATPIVLEAGLTKRLSLGLNVPIVKTINNIIFDVNPAGREGNIGFNPALSPTVGAQVLAANAAFLAQFQLAAQRLQGALDQCATAPANTTPQCAGLNAQRASATSLIASASGFASGVAQLYGTSATSTGSPFIPIAGTQVQQAIEARTSTFRTLYSAFLGAGNPITSAGPVASPNRLTVTDAQRILTDPAFGISASPLQTFERTEIGDIELGAKYLLIDPFGGDEKARYHPRGINFRTAITGAFRLGSGTTDLPTNFVDIGTGSGTNALSLRSSSDLLLGGNFWTSFIARATWQLADKQFVRISDRPNQQLTSLYRQRKVDRNLGNFYELEVTPRYVLSDYFSVSAQYLFRHKGTDTYKGTFLVPASVTGYSDIALNAATLNQETQQNEHRLGGGASFSTLAAFEDGRARLPLEITYLHYQTTKASGGNVPKQFTDQLQLRLYARIFGGPPEEKPMQPAPAPPPPQPAPVVRDTTPAAAPAPPPPPPDADNDGVVDTADACPNTPAGDVVDEKGCSRPKDADGDGVTDDNDKCPNTPAGTTVDVTGCAPVFRAGETVVELRGVTFETGKAVLTPDSRTVLDNVAASLVAHPDVRVEVAGHTDITGSRATNITLSKARANAVRAYLVDKGVPTERLTANGYGPDRPVASNKTPDGRALNRRVELRRR